MIKLLWLYIEFQATYIIIALAWILLEVWMIGYPIERDIDTLICTILSLVCVGFRNYRKERRKK